MPTSLSHELQRGTPSDEQAASTDRGWFLLDCAWNDAVWTLRPTSVLEEPRPVRLVWGFSMPNGRVFTDDRYAPLLESSRQLIGVIRRRGLSTGLAQRARTVNGYFVHLRELVRWMDRAGVSRFGSLDATAVRQFQRAIAERAGVVGDTLANTTVEKYLYLFTYLYRFRNEIDDGLTFDPFPGRSHRDVAGVRDADIRRWPYTPDAVAVALVKQAIDLVSVGAGNILQARQVYADAMASAEQRGCGRNASTNAATRALQQAALKIPGHDRSLTTVSDLARAIDMLYAACFVVIAYLVGARASEIRHLQAGCVQRHGAEPDSVTVIVGAIFKKQPEYHGRPHRWVAPPPAVQAIKVLEALSEGHRRQTGRDDLWLRRCRASGATEWRPICEGEIEIASTLRMRWLLNRFAAWLDLPDHDGKPWRLTTHQGRKTFVRFAALRDRSALFAIAQHLGHRERAVTDTSYCGSDYRLNQEIDAEILEQSVAAWEHMLATPALGGRAGREIAARRPRFRGARLKEDIKSYARMLTDAGLTLGVCDWGFCVYREEHSACLGNAVGPNPARREPSTCARCRNFAVTPRHRSYWLDQVDRHEALLHEPALPRQTLQIARSRLEEARAMMRAIDNAQCKEGNHGR
ncbi:MAG: hypothetical protein OXI07_05340 [Gammaproteobacteria bacterium]|nr:hypothetical protein [Gammaproteobacteria bacterium]